MAGLQRTELQKDGYHLTPCIFEVSGRAKNVNLLFSLVISVWKKTITVLSTSFQE